jgi:hypothetical protein
MQTWHDWDKRISYVCLVSADGFPFFVCWLSWDSCFTLLEAYARTLCNIATFAILLLLCDRLS